MGKSLNDSELPWLKGNWERFSFRSGLERGKGAHILGIPFLKHFRGPDGTGTLKGSSESIYRLHPWHIFPLEHETHVQQSPESRVHQSNVLLSILSIFYFQVPSQQGQRLIQVFLGFSYPLLSPGNLLIKRACFFYFCKKCLWNFDRDCIESIDDFL